MADVDRFRNAFLHIPVATDKAQFADECVVAVEAHQYTDAFIGKGFGQVFHAIKVDGNGGNTVVASSSPMALRYG